MDRVQDIRDRFYRKGESIRGIAKDLEMSRRTVAKYVESVPPWKYTLEAPRPRPVSGSIKEIVKGILLKDREVRNKKQHHTANRIYERLVEEHGFRGSERTVRRVVAELREQLRLEDKEVFLPLQFEYGQAFENDWIEPDVVMDGRLIKTSVFATRLRASRASFVVAQPTERQEALLDGLQRGLRFFGGVPAVGRFDNPATVVKVFGRRVDGCRRRDDRPRGCGGVVEPDNLACVGDDGDEPKSRHGRPLRAQQDAHFTPFSGAERNERKEGRAQRVAEGYHGQWRKVAENHFG